MWSKSVSEYKYLKSEQIIDRAREIWEDNIETKLGEI